MTTDTITLPTAADVDAAAKRLAGVAVRTPLLNFPVLDTRLNARVFLKAETLQRTGSFKFRGAYNRISSIPQDNRAAGVVAYSSGNHAQGVAHGVAGLALPVNELAGLRIAGHRDGTPGGRPGGRRRGLRHRSRR